VKAIYANVDRHRLRDRASERVRGLRRRLRARAVAVARAAAARMAVAPPPL